MNGLLAGAGVAIAAGSLIALFISESGKLFGFSETGYGTAIVLAIVAEALTVVLLTPVAVVSLRGPASDGSASADEARRDLAVANRALHPRAHRPRPVTLMAEACVIGVVGSTFIVR